jgi:O-antigen biosynthesis protein
MPSLERLSKYKVMLAPIRYGAGIKGKIVDSWLHKTPVVTGPIGAEGLFLDSSCEEIYSDFKEGESTFK